MLRTLVLSVALAVAGARLVQPSQSSDRSAVLRAGAATDGSLAPSLVTSADHSVVTQLADTCAAADCPELLTGGNGHLALLERLRGGGSFMDWVYKGLAKVGIFLKNGRLLVLGLDNAGKSTLLTVLLRNEVVPTAPTHQPVTDMITIGHMKLRAVDMGGHEIARRMWVQYAHEADGIVYIVDAADRERFGEAALELHKLLAAESLPPKAAVLVLANKCDLPHAATQEELYYALGLDELAQSGSARPIGLYLCSIFERRGYMEGFDWLATHI